VVSLNYYAHFEGFYMGFGGKPAAAPAVEMPPPLPQASPTANAAADRKAAAAMASGLGLNSTILTSAMGAADAPGTAAKKLFGS
jgi:hypothetical protein